MFIHFRIILGIYSIIILALLLWPYRFVFPYNINSNGAVWMLDEKRVDFQKSGLVGSASSPIGLHQKLVSGSGLTIEAWLTTARLNQIGPARIVSYSQDPYFRNFTLGQQDDGLIFRLRTTKTDLNGNSSEITVPGTFLPGKRQYIVVTYDFSHYRVYVDGQLRSSLQGPGGTFSNWDPDYQLLIGNEKTGNRPWIGSVEGLMIYDRPVSMGEVARTYESGGLLSGRSGGVASFDFSESVGNVFHDTSGVYPATTLELPEQFINKSTSDFLTLKRRSFMDFMINFAIFFPFGLLMFLSLSDFFGADFQAVAATMLATVLFALITESLQYFMEARTSSLFDLGSCLVGSLVGSLVAIALNPNSPDGLPV